jgi:CPA2 family monovalent cation:H+ antiporter-2
MRRIRMVRDEHYGLLRGLFHGASDEPDTVEAVHPRLHAVTLTHRSHAIGRAVGSLGLDALGVEVTAVRRPGRGKLLPSDAGVLECGDVVVLLGTPEALDAAEGRLDRS